MLRRGETVDAQALLDAAGATVPTGDIVQGVYDEAGAYYQIPNWIAADPEGLIQDEEGEAEPKKDEEVEETEPNSEKGKEKDDGGSDTVRVKARLSDRAQDVVIRTGRSERVGVLSKKVAEEAGVSVPASLSPFPRRLSMQYRGTQSRHLGNAQTALEVTLGGLSIC